jgi:aryl-alcohol dehydrogenase-like predicted oxidoreductase
MKKRPLGRSGIEVAPFALGTNVFGWTVDEPTTFLLLDAFVDRGFSLVDTADVYSKWIPGHAGGESETLIGKWLAKSGKRDRVVIATKVGMEMPDVGKGLSRRHILRAVEDSLRRLQVETIDLYQSHEEDGATPIEETLEAYAQLIREGKVRAIGASNYSAPSLAKALEVGEARKLPRYDSLQPKYNLYSRAEFEAGPMPLCVEKNVGVIPYFGLASGFLTGKYRSEADLGQSPRGQGVKQYLNARGYRILDALDAVAKGKHVKCSQVALAWLMARPGITAPIASATTLAQLRELMASVDVVLDPASMEMLDRASAEIVTPAEAGAQ